MSHPLVPHPTDGKWVIRVAETATERCSFVMVNGVPNGVIGPHEILESVCSLVNADTAAERDRLKAVNADLLALLRETLSFVSADAMDHGDKPGQGANEVLDRARAAIAEAEGGES